MRSQLLQPRQKLRRDLLLYILILLLAGRIVVFPQQQHLPHRLLITPERAGVQPLIRRVVVGVVQIIIPVVLDGVVKCRQFSIGRKHRRRHAHQPRQTPQVVILPIKSYLRREVLYRWVGDEPAVMPAVPVISPQLHARYSADLLQLLGVAPVGGG